MKSRLPRRQPASRLKLRQCTTNIMFKGARLLFVVLIFALHLIHIESRTIFGRHVIAAAIFGNKGENSKNTDGSQASLKTKPPPPPGRPPLLNGQKTSAAIPPPPPPMAMKNETPADGSTKGARNSEVQPPPPPPMQQEGKGWVQNDNIAANQEWMDYQQPSQQQFPFFPESHGYDPHMNQWPSLEQQLQDSLARENELYGQIQNFTATINAMEQQNQLHVRQMDVLTERIMDAENQIAKERNTALEYEANCTELGRQIASLHQELEDWQARCAEFADKQQANDSKIKELKRDLKAARAEAENLAISIENSRIRDQMGDNASKKKKKSRGLFGWLFSFFVSPTEPEVDTEDDQDPQELAKSTLLRALQIERNNVDELETFVTSLQQNNSAIAEMVKSRDLVIDELNDRVAVFEEDKVVLKAALKQLQKEMKEEAPKTQKLLDDLEAANAEVSRLNSEIESLIQTHQEEISALQNSIIQKQNAINATESNLTVIGKYVDKLEERLASFAITRRDVETREQKCKEIEEEAKQVKDERDSLRAKIEEFRQEESELKNLLEELVQERTNLRVENEKLVEERDTLSQGAQRSRETLASLENNMKRLDAETEKWRKTAASLEHQLNSTKSSTEEIQGGVKALNAENEELKNKLDEFQGLNSDLSEQLKAKSTELSKSQQLLETKSSDLKQVQEALQLKSDELRKSEAKVKEVSEKLERVKQELESKSSEMTKLQQQSGSNKGGMFGQKDSTQKQGDSASTNKSTASDARIETLFHSKEWDKNNVTAEATEPQGNATADQTLSKSPPTLLPARTKDGERPTKGAPQTSAKRKVPLRGVRKFFSKTTGIHGVFTRSSKQKLSKREPPKTKQALAPPPKFLPKAGPKPPPDHAATMKEDNKQKVGVEPKLPPSLHGRGQPPLPGQATNKQ